MPVAALYAARGHACRTQVTERRREQAAEEARGRPDAALALGLGSRRGSAAYIPIGVGGLSKTPLCHLARSFQTRRCHLHRCRRASWQASARRMRCEPALPQNQ